MIATPAKPGWPVGTAIQGRKDRDWSNTLPATIAIAGVVVRLYLVPAADLGMDAGSARKAARVV